MSPCGQRNVNRGNCLLRNPYACNWAPSKVLCGPDRTPLKVVGQTRVTLTSKGKSCSHDFYVVQQLKHNLLRLPAIRALAWSVKPMRSWWEPEEIHSKFPSLFTGLGTFEGEFEIHLHPDAQPFVLHTPRNIPLPLRKKFKDELKRMESLGMISKVDMPPTPGCAGMVVVPKQDGTVCICVDLKPLYHMSFVRPSHSQRWMMCWRNWQEQRSSAS